MTRTSIILFAALAILIPASATARHLDRGDAPSPDETGAVRQTLKLDVEIDPIAYVASGYSLHVGLGWDRYRLDLGAFAADMPEFVHGNTNFDVGFDGYGFKLDAFWRTDQVGPFVGIQGGLINVSVIEHASGVIDTDTRFQPGARIGWRIGLPAQFYLTPWIGVDYAFGVEDRVVNGETFEESNWSFFPTVHIGRRFM